MAFLRSKQCLIYFIIFFLFIFLISGPIACVKTNKKQEVRVEKKDIDELLADDQELLQLLADSGSNMETIHTIEYHFVAFEEEDALKLSSWAIDRGYRVSDITCDTYFENSYYYLNISVSMLPVFENISEYSIKMLKISYNYNCEYLGWSCEIIK
jgi:regulator of RNase E activity RraB